MRGPAKWPPHFYNYFSNSTLLGNNKTQKELKIMGKIKLSLDREDYWAKPSG